MSIQKTQGVLKSVSSKVKTLTNKEGGTTEYRQCTVEMPDGVVYFAKMWEKSYPNAVINQTYTVEMQTVGDDVWLTVLTGPVAKIATKADLAKFTTL